MRSSRAAFLTLGLNNQPLATITNSVAMSSAAGTAQATITWSPVNVGDLVLITVAVTTSSSITVTGVSGGGASWNGTAGAAMADAGSGITFATWWGTVTSTGSKTATVSFSGSVSGQFVAIAITSFHASVAGTWSKVNANTVELSSGAMPSVTSGSTGPQMYYGAALNLGGDSLSSGGTSGFVYTSSTFYACYNLALATSTAYAPVWTVTGGPGVYDGVAAIYEFTPS